MAKPSKKKIKQRPLQQKQPTSSTGNNVNPASSVKESSQPMTIETVAASATQAEFEKNKAALVKQVGDDISQLKRTKEDVEDAIENALAGRVDVAAKGREGVANVRNLEVATFGDPGGEEVLVGDEIAALALDELDRFLIVFHEARQILLGEITCLQAGDFGLGEELVEDEAQDVILVFICLDFRAHLVGGFPYL